MWFWPLTLYCTDGQDLQKVDNKVFFPENVLLSFVFLLVESVIIPACTISSIAHASPAFCVRLNLLFLVGHSEAIFTWMHVKSIGCFSSHGIPTPVRQGKGLCLSWPAHNPKPWPHARYYTTWLVLNDTEQTKKKHGDYMLSCWRHHWDICTPPGETRPIERIHFQQKCCVFYLWWKVLFLGRWNVFPVPPASHYLSSYHQ